MHHIALEMMMSQRLMPALLTTLFQKNMSSTIEKNIRSLARQISLSVDGTTHNMQFFFTQWRFMTISMGTNLRESLIFLFLFVWWISLTPKKRQIIYEIEHGEQTISESEWPAFLYPRGTSPDVEDDQAGLFRGYLLPRVSLSWYMFLNINYFIGL